MSSDKHNRPADRALGYAGIGVWHGFRCQKCGHKRDTLGRRMRLFRGLRQWLCAHCVEAR